MTPREIVVVVVVVVAVVVAGHLGRTSGSDAGVGGVHKTRALQGNKQLDLLQWSSGLKIVTVDLSNVVLSSVFTH